MKKSLLSLAFAGAMALALTSCGGATNKENVPLTLSSQELDGVFNPFFSTSAPDSNILSMTQISMLTNTKEGDVACGEDEPVVVLDYDINTKGSGESQTTTYSFVLKNNIKFSDGVPLTIKDVFFNLYVYLDPVYTGSSTIYSTDIVGLQEYRTQSADKNEQDSFMEAPIEAAKSRVENLAFTVMDFRDENQGSFTEAELKEHLESMLEDSGYENLLRDYELAKKLFTEELNQYYVSSKDLAKDIVIDGKKGLLKTDTEVFLYNLGYINYNKNDEKLECLLDDINKVRAWNQEVAVNTVFNDLIPTKVDEVITGWGTSDKLMEILINEEVSKMGQGEEMLFPNISGIKFANMDETVTVNNKTYPKVEYNADGSAKTNEVLEITIHKVDPKAIWNFGFPVAPMHYYSDKEHTESFSIKDNRFGVEYKNQDWMTNVVKDPEKTGVPMGAGAYVAAKPEGGTDNVEPGDFRQFNTVYFEANPNFMMGEPKIKLLRYRVIPQSGLLNSLKTNEIDFIQPNASPETVNELNGLKSKGFENKQIQTSGYGYIGINASKIPSRFVRMTIMHTIDTKSCVDFYKGSAEMVNRSLSKSSWAYPVDSTPYYPYIGGKVPENLDVVNPLYKEFVESRGIAKGSIMTEKQQSDFIKFMLEDNGGFTLNGNNVYVDEYNHVCKYTFTIAGSETDHPAWAALFNASNILNKNGFDVLVVNDQQALQKLNSGQLTVWAAAWGSTIDPDLYQIYHMDSKATSVNNWGYKAILFDNTGRYDYEKAVVEELSDLIDMGRSTTDQTNRTQIYAKALDKIMELAVELPTYQRDDLFAYNANKIKSSTLVPDKELSPYNGLLSRMWTVELVK